MIRAKFRCMGVDSRWDRKSAEFLPVMHRQGAITGEEADAAENEAFWKATPAGTITLQLSLEQECPFEPGSYYYVDMEQTEDGLWKLEPVTLWVDSIEIKMRTAWHCCKEYQQGDLTMSIDNKVTWPRFTGNVGSKWDVKLTPATRRDGED